MIDITINLSTTNYNKNRSNDPGFPVPASHVLGFDHVWKRRRDGLSSYGIIAGIRDLFSSNRQCCRVSLGTGQKIPD